jgi:hypothetical protein
MRKGLVQETQPLSLPLAPRTVLFGAYTRGATPWLGNKDLAKP